MKVAASRAQRGGSGSPLHTGVVVVIVIEVAVALVAVFVVVVKDCVVLVTV
jgi:hypothetical protein